MRYDKDRKVFVVGERELPVSDYIADNYVEEEQHMRAIGSARPRSYVRRVVIPFENTWALSVVWGDMTYSDNDWPWHEKEQRPFVEDPQHAEVGVLMPENGLLGDPFSMVDGGEVLRLCAAVNKLPSKDYEVEVPDSWGTDDLDQIAHFEEWVTIGLMALEMKEGTT